MVSNTLGTTIEDLLAALYRIRGAFADDPEYQELRRAFPADWPV